MTKADDLLRQHPVLPKPQWQLRLKRPACHCGHIYRLHRDGQACRRRDCSCEQYVPRDEERPTTLLPSNNEETPG